MFLEELKGARLFKTLYSFSFSLSKFTTIIPGLLCSELYPLSTIKAYSPECSTTISVNQK